MAKQSVTFSGAVTLSGSWQSVGGSVAITSGAGAITFSVANPFSSNIQLQMLADAYPGGPLFTLIPNDALGPNAGPAASKTIAGNGTNTFTVGNYPAAPLPSVNDMLLQIKSPDSPITDTNSRTITVTGITSL